MENAGAQLLPPFHSVHDQSPLNVSAHIIGGFSFLIYLKSLSQTCTEHCLLGESRF